MTAPISSCTFQTMEPYEENLAGIKQYLEGMITVCKDHPLSAYNKLILEQGEVFYKVVHSDKIAQAKEWRKNNRPQIKQCFYNSQLFVVVSELGDYYEGYCHDGLLPFHHAWNVIDGKVVDFTLEARDRSLKRQKIKNNATSPAYLGVKVPKRALMENIVKTGVAEPIAQKVYLKMDIRFL